MFLVGSAEELLILYLVSVLGNFYAFWYFVVIFQTYKKSF